MSFNRVVWSEGLFLRPQHFQQQDRYMERFVETRCQGLIPHAWGFTEVELERDLLGIGKFGVRRASGVFPDGTPFRLADDDPLPPALEIDVQVRDQLVYLAVPLRRAGEAEFERPDATDRMARHQIREWEARDTTSATGDPAVVEVGALSTRLLLASQVTDAYATIPIAHIAEARPDKRVLLDDSFMPTVLHARAATRLATFASELLGLLHQRGDALGGRVAATGRGAAAEFAEFLMLQAINRYEPLLAHYADTGGVHPEQLYELFVSIAGEMATFTSISKRPPAFPGYRHDRLARVVRAGDGRAAQRLCRRDGAGGHPDSDRDEEVRHQRRARHRTRPLQQCRVRARGARRRAVRGTASQFPVTAQGGARRTDRGSRASRPAGCAGAAAAGRAAADPVSCRLGVLRAGSKQ